MDQTLENHILQYREQIEQWFQACWEKAQSESTTLFTSSVDIRNAGYKIAVVDTNLFPAGFNNLHPTFFSLGVQAAQDFLHTIYPGCKKILIVPENHTRNIHYYQSIDVLYNMIQHAGYEVKIGSLLLDEITTVKLPHGKTCTLHPLHRDGNKIACGHFIPDMIILNNDLSTGIPPLLENLDQPLEPPAQLGWNFRSKTQHFKYYQAICEIFSALIDIDPWKITPLFTDCDAVDFVEKIGMELLIDKTQTLLHQIQQKYDQYEIPDKPYVVIKADAGTYGMAVLPIHSADELVTLSRKQRLNMSMSKGKRSVHHVLIQEGIPTYQTVNTGPHQAVAEPVIYMLGQQVIGGFYRVHSSRNQYENLNSPGMHFEKWMPAQDPASKNIFYMYSVIARLALLASYQEKVKLCVLK